MTNHGSRPAKSKCLFPEDTLIFKMDMMQQAPCDIGQVKDISDNIYLRGAKPISALILLVSSMDRDSFAPPPLLAPTLPLLSSFSSRLEDFFEERSLSLRLSRDLERSLLSRWRSLERDLDLLRLLSRSLSRDLDLENGDTLLFPERMFIHLWLRFSLVSVIIHHRQIDINQ